MKEKDAKAKFEITIASTRLESREILLLPDHGISFKQKDSSEE